LNQEIFILYLTAVSIGFFHTLLGPDHYLPFVAMAKAGKWSPLKTGLVTAICGLGHVLSSVIIGFFGIGLGLGIEKITGYENWRGDGAAWLLIAFGFFYMVYGIKRAIRNKPHSHLHVHEDGTFHRHEHSHDAGHAHVHEKKYLSRWIPWSLFVIFVFGPCEPLIPVLMYPAAGKNLLAVWGVAFVFSATTILTMLSIVFLSVYGIRLHAFSRLNRFSHACAGFVILCCGLAIELLGL